jgi:multidrug efflux system outer membrane protein
MVVAALALGSVLPANADQMPSGSHPLAAPLQLSEAIREALQHGPSLRSADEALATAEIRERLAESAFDIKIQPSLSAATDAGGVGHRDFGVGITKRLQTGGEARLSANPFRGYSFSLTQPLLHGFGPSATSELVSARRSEAGAVRAREDAGQHLVLTVAQAYFSVARLQRMVQAGEMALERATRLRNASDARVKVGLSTQLDVLRADLLVVESQASLGDQREGLASALDQLNVLMGRPLDSPIAIAIDDGLDGEERDDMPTDEQTLLGRALETRPDVLEARDRISDAERALRVARWDLLPRIDLNLSYARRSFGSGSANLLSSISRGWQVNLSTSYSLDRSSQAAATGLAAVTIAGARRALMGLEQQVGSEVRSAMRARQRAAATVAIQRKAVDVAERQLRLAELRYQRGLAGNSDVIDAESSLFRAQSALLSAQADRALTQLLFERTLGTLNPERFLQ